MELICAGFPKTASKSCSNALRQLGYRVADMRETIIDLSNVWVDFMTGQTSIEEVIAEYNQHGYQANQDMPGNMYWEDLYNASPDAKVILTVRDSEHAWWNSWYKFMDAQYNREAIGDVNLARLFDAAAAEGYLGPMSQRMSQVLELATQHGGIGVAPSYSVKRQLELLKESEDRMKEAYLAHKAHVINTVPAERLLIWNLKDGWSPLCQFLNVPEPDNAIPHDNKTSEPNWCKDYILNSEISSRAVNYAVVRGLRALATQGLYGIMANQERSTVFQYLMRSNLSYQSYLRVMRPFTSQLTMSLSTWRAKFTVRETV